MKKTEKRNEKFKKIFNIKMFEIFLMVLTTVIGVWNMVGNFLPLDTIVEDTYRNDWDGKINCLTNSFGRVNMRDENIPVIFQNDPSISIRFLNDNNKIIYMKSIWVKVYYYESIENFEEDNQKRGLGDLLDEIKIEASLNSKKGKYAAILEDKDKNWNSIIMEAGDADLYLLSLEFEEEGIYDIAIEFIYGYGKKEYRFETDRTRIVGLKNMRITI